MADGCACLVEEINPYLTASVQATQIDFGAATKTYDPEE